MNIYTSMLVWGITFSKAKMVCQKYGARYFDFINKGGDIFYKTMIPITNADDIITGLLNVKKSNQSLTIVVCGKQYDSFGDDDYWTNIDSV